MASCKEDTGDYQGALECYRTVFDKMGNFKVAFESVKRIEAIMGCKSGVIPAHMDIENPSDTEDKDKDMRDMIQKAFNSSPRAFHNTSNMDRCSQCKRGGIKLSICSLCKDDRVQNIVQRPAKRRHGVKYTSTFAGKASSKLTSVTALS